MATVNNDKEAPFFSVVMPVYNAGALLEKAIASVLGQSFAGFELLLIDDGSSDGSPGVCDAAAASDARVRVLHQNNGGIVAGTNKGIEMAAGLYAFFVDHDDEVPPNALRTMHSAIVGQGTWPDMLQCNFAYIKDGVVEKSGITLPAQAVPIGKRQRRDFFYSRLFADQLGMVLALWTKAIKLEFVRNAKISGDSRYISAVDGDITLKIIAATAQIAFLDEVVYHWRVGTGHTLSKTGRPEVVKARICWFRHVFNLSFSAGLSKKTRERMRVFAIKQEAAQLEQIEASAFEKCGHRFRTMWFPGFFAMPWYMKNGWYWRIVYPLGVVFGHQRVQGLFAKMGGKNPPDRPDM